MKENITARLTALRETMKNSGVDAYVIPSSDPHLSEYPPECWKDRVWISGFTGSAGTVVVTLKDAGLWTDSRYFLQAGTQLEGSGIDLYKDGLPETPSITKLLRDRNGEIKVVGFNGKAMSYQEAQGLRQALSVAGIDVRSDLNLISEIREEPVQLPMDKLFVHPLEYAGASPAQKVDQVRKKLKDSGAEVIILNMLDEVAWLFNLRGSDVSYNPVGIAYGMITPEEVSLYVDEKKLAEEVRDFLAENHVSIKPYESIYEEVQGLSDEWVVSVDPARINDKLFHSIPKDMVIVQQLSPITLLKACKNEAECHGYQAAMKRDGVALTRFFMWLERSLDEGKELSEYDLGVVLSDYRSQGEYYVSDSFATIAGYNGNGAIVHYSAAKDTASKISASGILLLDSGGQYRDGTTDITRTISLDGKPSQKQKDDYTRVMKGHIGIATAIFPQGTRGVQLDILAKKALWDNCQNFGHGTGHGVGHFLNVHEGPQNIRVDLNPTPLMPGMVTSNEPGLYIAGEYGIRIENLVRTVPYRDSEFGSFYAFETLTLCYFDNSLINADLMTDKELEWYNAYQKRVYDTLAPELTEEEASWLKNKTQPLARP